MSAVVSEIKPAEKPRVTGLALLREPFADNQVSLLPKQLKKDDQAKEKCKAGCNVSADGYYCGGFHARSIHLSYVGHAALTDRLLEVDPGWTWEPMSLDANGLPVLDKDGGLWIRLTVLGTTRLGYGDAAGKTGGNAMKERIGDALRNAAMRFGAALEFWHKGVLHLPIEDEDDPRLGGDNEGKGAGAPPPAPPAEKTLPVYTDEEFAGFLPTWRAKIAGGTDAKRLVAMLSSKRALSKAQVADILKPVDQVMAEQVAAAEVSQ